MHSKYLSLSLKISAALTPHQRSFVLQLEIITESHSLSKYREQMIMGGPPQTDTSATQILHLGLRGITEEG